MESGGFLQDVRRHAAVVRTRWRLLAACVASALLLAFAHNHTTRPEYRATAQILIAPATPKVLPAAQAALDAGIQDYETEYQLLGGRTLAEGVVHRLGLESQPELAAGPAVDAWSRFARLAARVLGLPARGVDADPQADTSPLSPAAAAVRSRLVIEPLPGGRLVNLHFHAYDPALAAKVANAVAHGYIGQTAGLRRASSSEATGWLSARLLEQKEKLDRAERNLIAYQARHGLVESGAAGGPGDGTLAEIDEALAAARLDRIAREALLAHVRALPPSRLATVPALIADSAVQQVGQKVVELQAEQARLAGSLGEKHPEMLRLQAETASARENLEAALLAAVRSLEGEVRTARSREAALEAGRGLAQEEKLEAGRDAIEYQALKREVESQRQLFQALTDRTKETGLESEMTATGIRLMEPARVPRTPYVPRAARNYRIALLVGLVLGIGLIGLLEQADDSVKTPDDIKSLGLTFLGLVPDVDPQATGSGDVTGYRLKDPQKLLAEAYRILRTNLIFSTPPEGHMLLVTSANPGEGKTTTAVNLARALALNGARVLIVDADLRRPAVHRHFDVGRVPGLSDLIVTRCRASQAIHATRLERLQVLSSGRTSANPPELLGSESMRQILLALRTHYDWVVIDTPPVLSMADTPVLCSSADGIVVVVAAEQSTRAEVRRTLEQIAAVGGKVAGAVLQRVDMSRNFYYYGRYYREYFRADEPPAGQAAGTRDI